MFNHITQYKSRCLFFNQYRLNLPSRFRENEITECVKIGGEEGLPS